MIQVLKGSEVLREFPVVDGMEQYADALDFYYECVYAHDYFKRREVYRFDSDNAEMREQFTADMLSWDRTIGTMSFIDKP